MSYNHEFPYTDPYRANADWLIHKVKEFGETLHSWEDTINQLIAALAEINAFDDRISALENATADLPEIRARLSALEASLENAFKDIATLEERLNNINVDYELVLEEVARLAGLFPEFLEEANEYTDIAIDKQFIDFTAKFYDIQRQIDELRKLRPIELINPLRGLKYDLQDSYNLAYADMRDDCLTVSQYDELGVTSNQYDAYNMNALEFALHSRTIFKWDYVTAPISGLYKSISHALSEVVTFLLGSLTCNEYEALDYTSDEYNALDLSSVDYLKLSSASSALTSSEYSNIMIVGGSDILRRK